MAAAFLPGDHFLRISAVKGSTSLPFTILFSSVAILTLSSSFMLTVRFLLFLGTYPDPLRHPPLLQIG